MILAKSHLCWDRSRWQDYRAPCYSHALRLLSLEELMRTVMQTCCWTRMRGDARGAAAGAVAGLHPPMLAGIMSPCLCLMMTTTC